MKESILQRQKERKHIHTSQEYFKLCHTSLLTCPIICFLNNLQAVIKSQSRGESCREVLWFPEEESKADVCTRCYGSEGVPVHTSRRLSFSITKPLFTEPRWCDLDLNERANLESENVVCQGRTEPANTAMEIVRNPASSSFLRRPFNKWEFLIRFHFLAVS